MTMKIRCFACGSVVELPITRAQYDAWKESGEFVQDFFPELNAGQRETLINEICERCFDNLFGVPV
jgi:DNA-directed RNA polymerase subunit N (RpoN/RPB10)